MSDHSALRRPLEGLRQQPEQLIDIILQHALAIEELQKQVEDLKNQIRIGSGSEYQIYCKNYFRSFFET